MKIKVFSGLLAILLCVFSLCSCTQLFPNQETNETEAPHVETETPHVETEAPHVHSYGEWKTAKSSCLSDGLKYRSCSCGETEQQTVAVTGHVGEKGKCTLCGLDFFTELASLILKYGSECSSSVSSDEWYSFSEALTVIDGKTYRSIGIAYHPKEDIIEINFIDKFPISSNPGWLTITFDRYMFENYEYQWSSMTSYFTSAEGTFSAPTFSSLSTFSYSIFECSEGEAGSIAKNATETFRKYVVDFFRSFIEKSDQCLALIDYGFERLK